MYYKIENKDCEVYKKLHELRTSELQFGKDNEAAIRAKIPYDWSVYMGHTGQQNFRRTAEYQGFKFTNDDIDLKVWKKSKEYNGVFVPNMRTKAGREMSDFLLNGLKGTRYSTVLDILEVDHLRRFTFPYVEIVGDLILIYLNDGHEPKDPNVIEITKREFQDKVKALTP